MKKRAFLIILAIAALASAAWKGPAAARSLRHRQEWSTFRSFAGRDLRKLDPAERARMRAALAALGKPEPTHTHAPYPWTFGRVDDDRWLLFLASGYTGPGSYSQGEVVIFDDAGALVAETSFDAGAFDIENAAFERHDGRTVLVVSSSEVREVYGLLRSGDFALLRLEHESRASPNDYRRPEWTIVGPNLPDRDEQAWVDALSSPDRFEVLRTLVVLGGRHEIFPPPRDEEDAEREKPTTARAVLGARSRSAARLAELAKDRDSWVADAAELAR